jgi:protein-S-isoprenylcysteine O-methyltransferase Ste14
MVNLPPPVWAVIYVALAAALSWVLGWPSGASIVWLGVALIVAGGALAVSAAMLFRREGTEINPTSASNRTLVVSGPYAFTRNPMYLSLVLLTLGVAFCIGSWPMFLAPLATFATANFVHIPFEEGKMRRQFGDLFDAYAKRVRRWV